LTAAEKVKAARKPARPTSLQFIEKIFDGFTELHGDRCFGDDKAVIGGVAFLGEIPVTVIGLQKGRGVEDNVRRNFGSAHPEGYRKSLRLMKQAEKFNRPIITFVNTPGAFCGVGAEERGQGEAIARNLFEMSGLKTPIVSVFIGEGGSGGALALALADKIFMLSNAIYSILSPEGFASILWKDASRAEEAAELMKLTASELFSMGVIDKVIDEGDICCEEGFNRVAESIKRRLVKEISKLTAKDEQELLIQRYEKFRKFGEFAE